MLCQVERKERGIRCPHIKEKKDYGKTDIRRNNSYVSV